MFEDRSTKPSIEDHKYSDDIFASDVTPGRTQSGAAIKADRSVCAQNELAANFLGSCRLTIGGAISTAFEELNAGGSPMKSPSTSPELFASPVSGATKERPENVPFASAEPSVAKARQEELGDLSLGKPVLENPSKNWEWVQKPEEGDKLRIAQGVKLEPADLAKVHELRKLFSEGNLDEFAKAVRGLHGNPQAGNILGTLLLNQTGTFFGNDKNGEDYTLQLNHGTYKLDISTNPDTDIVAQEQTVVWKKLPNGSYDPNWTVKESPTSSSVSWNAIRKGITMSRLR